MVTPLLWETNKHDPLSLQRATNDLLVANLSSHRLFHYVLISYVTNNGSFQLACFLRPLTLSFADMWEEKLSKYCILKDISSAVYIWPVRIMKSTIMVLSKVLHML